MDTTSPPGCYMSILGTNSQYIELEFGFHYFCQMQITKSTKLALPPPSFAPTPLSKAEREAMRLASTRAAHRREVFAPTVSSALSYSSFVRTDEDGNGAGKTHPNRKG